MHRKWKRILLRLGWVQTHHGRWVHRQFGRRTFTLLAAAIRSGIHVERNVRRKPGVTPARPSALTARLNHYRRQLFTPLRQMRVENIK